MTFAPLCLNLLDARSTGQVEQLARFSLGCILYHLDDNSFICILTQNTTPISDYDNLPFYAKTLPVDCVVTYAIQSPIQQFPRTTQTYNIANPPQWASKLAGGGGHSGGCSSRAAGRCWCTGAHRDSVDALNESLPDLVHRAPEISIQFEELVIFAFNNPPSTLGTLDIFANLANITNISNIHGGYRFL